MTKRLKSVFLYTESFPITTKIVSVSFGTCFLSSPLTFELVCSGDSGITSGVGLISVKDSGIDNFVHLSAFVAFNPNSGGEIGTAERGDSCAMKRAFGCCRCEMNTWFETTWSIPLSWNSAHTLFDMI